MSFRQPTSRWALWVFAAALLLKSAMPFLASASAQMQGKTLVEVCTVYGVSMVPLGSSGHEPAPEHVADHSGEHCVLSALVAFASAEPPGLAPVPVAPRAGALRTARPSPRAPDACAAWVARLKHGPPAFA
jgi:hypothetical protein